MDNKIQIFEDKRIRTAWNEETEEWYFSVSDVVEILTDSRDVKQYIKKMRSRDAELNSKWGTICTPQLVDKPISKSFCGAFFKKRSSFQRRAAFGRTSQRAKFSGVRKTQER